MYNIGMYVFVNKTLIISNRCTDSVCPPQNTGSILKDECTYF